jgi:hypothetical protein
VERCQCGRSHFVLTAKYHVPCSTVMFSSTG